VVQLSKQYREILAMSQNSILEILAMSSKNCLSNFSSSHEKIQTPWTIRFYIVKTQVWKKKLWSKKHKFLDLAMVLIFWFHTKILNSGSHDLALLSLYIFWGKCVYFSIFEWWNSQLWFFEIHTWNFSTKVLYMSIKTLPSKMT
jgi:hypothetical protein